MRREAEAEAGITTKTQMPQMNRSVELKASSDQSSFVSKDAATEYENTLNPIQESEAGEGLNLENIETDINNEPADENLPDPSAPPAQF